MVDDVDDKKEGFFYSIGIGDYHNPIWEALFNNQYEGMTEGFKHYSLLVCLHPKQNVENPTNFTSPTTKICSFLQDMAGICQKSNTL